MMILIVGGLIFGLLFLFFIGWFFSTWNRLVSLEENVNQSWANIDVLLKQRYDMLPNLENIVSEFVDHEKEIFGELGP